MFDTGCLYRIEHRFRLGSGARQRLLAKYVFARFCSRNAGFGVRIVRSAIVQNMHIVISNQIAPIGVGMFVTIALRRQR